MADIELVIKIPEELKNKILQRIEGYIMKEILIFLIFALAVFAAILINEGGK